MSQEIEVRLEFETAPFLHSLFANDAGELRYLEQKLGVRTVTRDGWILIAGPAPGVEAAERAFRDLEDAKRNGAEIEARDFQMAIDLAAQGGEGGVSALSGVRLLGFRGRKPVVPKTPTQLEYLQTIEASDVTFGLGPAGTGKTYLAMAMALSMLKAKLVQRIVLTRPAVEAGEALGFLPGDMREKVAPYLRPLYDAIHDMIGFEQGERYFEDGTIEIAPLAFMRGRTLARSFVILDEAQNTTREQMFMALTRLGEDSRMVVTGDSSQVDLKPNISSGLTEAERALEGVKGIGFVRFTGDDVVRHPVVGRIITAYRKARGN
ncbi:PhoH family protein [Haloferula sargassicola]|uniref:PhoH-like protein n=1 Tax=Haloferula sargassicola TaxID=490096 RepID=A0ABP9ULM4_9BACT